MNIKILHLFPDLMNLYGDYGNILMLKKYIQGSGIDVTVDKKDIGENFDIMSYDIVYIGSGTESASLKALSELMPYKKDITAYVESSRLFIATGNAFELFGKSIKDDKTGEAEGLGLFNYIAERTHRKRYLGDAVFAFAQDDNKIIGFVNKCSQMVGISSPLFNVLMGQGNDTKSTTEGFVYKNFYGTSLIGPLLVRNPHFCRYIANIAFEGKGFKPTSSPDMALKTKAYGIALGELLNLMAKS